MDKEEIQKLIVETIANALSIEIAEHSDMSYGDKGFKVIVKLDGDEIASDYYYLPTH